MDGKRRNGLRILYTVLLLAVFAAGFVFVCASVVKQGQGKLLLSEEESREALVNENLPYRAAALLPYRAVNAFLDRRYYPDGNYLIRPDGMIMTGSKSLQGEEAAKHVKRLYDACREEGREFLYVLCPGKPESDEEMRQYGLLCYRNEAADLFLRELNGFGVPALDLRPAIWNAGRAEGDPYGMFYKSDHHWTADAGRIAAEEIAVELNRLYGTGLNTEALGADRMRREVREEEFVGETGEKLLGGFGTGDHLVILQPKDPVRLHYSVPLEQIDRQGDFDILFHEERAMTGTSAYYYYLGGNDQLGCIENADGGDSSILLIKDSFSCVMTPFLALSAGRITWWDMREDRAVLSYIREHPEIKTVVVMYNMSISVKSDYNDYQ